MHAGVCPYKKVEESMQTAEAFTLRQYFSDITRFAHLSDEEVHLLCQQIATAHQQQDRQAETQARCRLVEGLLPEVLPTAYHYACKMEHFTLLDLIQQGNYGLVLAAHRFDFADTSRAFGSYALTYIRSLIKSDLHRDGGIAIPNASFYTQRARRTLDAPLLLHHVRLDAVRGQDGEECTLLNMLAAPPLVLSSAHQGDSSVRAQVEHLLAILPAREQQVLRLRYGLDEQDGRTLDRQDVALLLGLSVQQVAVLERQALQVLRYQVGLQGASPGSERMQQYHQRRRQDQQARLQAAYEHLQAQGQPITRDALCAQAHVDTRAAGIFLAVQGAQGLTRRKGDIDWSKSTQERLEAAFAQLVAQGERLSVPRLKAAAHVGASAARAFLRNRSVPPQKSPGRPRKAVVRQSVEVIHAAL